MKKKIIILGDSIIRYKKNKQVTGWGFFFKKKMSKYKKNYQIKILTKIGMASDILRKI